MSVDPPREVPDSPSEDRICLQCGKVIPDPDRAVATDEGLFCLDCFAALRQQVQHAVHAQSTDINYSAALVGGVLGGAVGTLVWWGFTTLTGISFGLVAIVIGFTVSKGILQFTGGKRSLNLQVLSVAIAALSFFYGQYLVTRTFLLRYFAEQSAPVDLPLLPDPGVLYDVVRLDFGLFDLVFLAIVVFQAWRIPAPFRLRVTEES